MAKDFFDDRCRGCGACLRVERLGCPDCNLTIEGAVELPRLARLSAEEREFIEIFVLSAGSLKETGRILDLSYPTVRARLDRTIESLRRLDADRADRRMAILQELKQKNISVEDALAKLAQLGE